MAHETYLGGEGQPPLYIYIFNIVTRMLGFWVWGIQLKTKIELENDPFISKHCVCWSIRRLYNNIFEEKVYHISSKATADQAPHPHAHAEHISYPLTISSISSCPKIRLD